LSLLLTERTILIRKELQSVNTSARAALHTDYSLVVIKGELVLPATISAFAASGDFLSAGELEDALYT
jgi:hypothetical protein